MPRTWFGLLAACVAFSVAPIAAAEAGYVSGSDLLESCKPRITDAAYRLKVAECRGYVIGVADIFDCSTAAFGFRWNSRTPVSQEDLVSIVIRWLNAHPRERGFQAGGLIAAALSESFPCDGR